VGALSPRAVRLAEAAAASHSGSRKPSAVTIAYLREREQVTSVHREVKRSVRLENEARQRVGALVYVVDRGRVQYAGRLSSAEQLRHVLQGHGQSGVNRDYVLATVKAIEAEGFRDSQLHRLAMMLHDSHSLHPAKQDAEDASSIDSFNRACRTLYGASRGCRICSPASTYLQGVK
jgi:hypothetical protein